MAGKEEFHAWEWLVPTPSICSQLTHSTAPPGPLGVTKPQIQSRATPGTPGRCGSHGPGPALCSCCYPGFLSGETEARWGCFSCPGRDSRNARRFSPPIRPWIPPSVPNTTLGSPHLILDAPSCPQSLPSPPGSPQSAPGPPYVSPKPLPISPRLSPFNPRPTSSTPHPPLRPQGPSVCPRAPTCPHGTPHLTLSPPSIPELPNLP